MAVRRASRGTSGSRTRAAARSRSSAGHGSPCTIRSTRSSSLDEGSSGSSRGSTRPSGGSSTGGTCAPERNAVGTIGDRGSRRSSACSTGTLRLRGRRGLSGVLAEPNPFSPNGDGLYDETTVTFYLGRAADHVNIEFYDLDGQARQAARLPAADELHRPHTRPDPVGREGRGRPRRSRTGSTSCASRRSSRRRRSTSASTPRSRC